jgi:leucyl-tRNA synthetase
MDYKFSEIEAKWQQYWVENQTYQVSNHSERPKFYVLDMFPYPSGAGLHVGHPLGYIASDIYSRFKNLKGFNVLHPMGFDAFGLPAEQYAIETGQHPAETTQKNIATYKAQLNKMGLCYDWTREVVTAAPEYYRWTQWVFLQLFKSWYNQDSDKAESIESLIQYLEKNGTEGLKAAQAEALSFTAQDWKSYSEQAQQKILLNYRLAYLSEAEVNWCPALGTVLANDEVKDGVSERGGHPVIKKKMPQWSLRITAYADRLLKGLDSIDWTESIKESQRNWIGKSYGASVQFAIADSTQHIEVFTTRPDTIFGVGFIALAPEFEGLLELCSAAKKGEVASYINEVKNKSERERQADIRQASGVFTGVYAIHPFTQQKVEIWVAEYVLAGYGTGAVMGVPAHDGRDYFFAKHFNLPILQVVEGGDISKEAYEAKEGIIINSEFLNGLDVKKAIQVAIQYIEQKGIGKPQVNFRLRDAAFGRQRYWGEPIPVYYKEGIPYPIDEQKLPLILPEIDSFLPTEDGEPPLARAQQWSVEVDGNQYPIETTTMPGWAGSSWYFFRYMDAQNTQAFADKKALDYWKNVDVYLGGAEHATGHLLYARFWTKFLKDLGYVSIEEPAHKLINQGMIQGRSNFVYRVKNTNTYVSADLKSQYETTALHVDVNIVKNDVLDIEAFKKWRPDYQNAEFILNADKEYICGVEVEKMSKSKWNVVNPDDIIQRYGADTFRMYEMFLGPIELHKPWNTNGIEGVFKFLRKFWKLFHNEQFELDLSHEAPSKEMLKSLHKTIKKIEEDVERFSFNTCISTFMICVNELTAQGCKHKAILEPMCVLLQPFAPHISEELWTILGNAPGSLSKQTFPVFDEQYLVEDAFDYPVSINGKTKLKLNLSLSLTADDLQKELPNMPEIQSLLNGASPKKLIVVHGRIINIVI